MTNLRAIAIEAVMVGALALTAALIANAISPRGLRLTRDYFPAAPPALSLVSNEEGPVGPGPHPTQGSDRRDAVQRRLERQGLQAAHHEEVARWFRDPQQGQGLIVFVDARDEAHYRAGHIPGAWPFNHYRAEATLPAVLPACLAALKVIVYCTGGDCEDSEFAAAMLRDAGVPRENIFVYPGGMAEWTAHALPVETGARGSGQPRMSPP